MKSKKKQLKSGIDFVDAQARLSILSGTSENIFFASKWKLLVSEGEYQELNFDDIKHIETLHPDWELNTDLGLDTVVKLALLDILEQSSLNTIVTKYTGLALFFSSLASRQIEQVTLYNLKEIISDMLVLSWGKGVITKRMGIVSYGTSHNYWQLESWKKTFSMIGLDLVEAGVLHRHVLNARKELVPALTDGELTYADWRQGGNFNFLTLDYGCFYVDHCLSFFSEHVALASALTRTKSMYKDISTRVGLNSTTGKRIVSFILDGSSLGDLKSIFNSESTNMSQHKLELFIDEVSNVFESAYRAEKMKSTLMDSTEIKKLVEKIGLSPSQENIDRLQVITWDFLQKGNEVETARLLKRCQNPIKFHVYIKRLNELKERLESFPCRIPTVKEYQALGLKSAADRFTTNRYSYQLIKMVECTGLVSILALTGWRRSEFGFPSSAIIRKENGDKLDQYACPWRYGIDWYVFKTNGKVREKREVTFGIVLLCEQLGNVIGAKETDPLLFPVKSNKTSIINSGAVVKKAAIKPWGHFVENYKDFLTLDDRFLFDELIDIEKSGVLLNDVQLKEKKRLLSVRSASEWAQFEIAPNLKEAWRKSRESQPYLEFYFTSSSLKEKRNWLLRYKDGNLRQDWTMLVDSLPEEMKCWIDELTEEDCKKGSIVKKVSEAIVEDCLYPTPHAFRHMWAEAVYRRFDGDVGWMIRSHFKHISKSMWLAYVRNKDNKLLRQQVKIKVISSLLNNYLKNKGKDYSGKMNVWLRRRLKNTTLMSPEEQKREAEKIAVVEIEDINAHPWGYCILRKRTRNKARCAEDGEPKPHNASPEICTNCTHNLMQSENIDWLLMHIYTHVEALKNPLVPALFKASSFNLVKSVMDKVTILNPKHESLPELRTVLQNN